MDSKESLNKNRFCGWTVKEKKLGENVNNVTIKLIIISVRTDLTVKWTLLYITQTLWTSLIPRTFAVYIYSLLVSFNNDF